MCILYEKTAFITGGGQGIGKGIALEMANAGANVIIAQRNLMKLEETVAEIKKIGGKAIGIRIDVTDMSSIENGLQEALVYFPNIDILVNNAGVMQNGIGYVTTAEDFDFCHAVNLKAIWQTTLAITPHFKSRNQGNIINISSGAGRRGIPMLPAYSASKAAVLNLTQSLALSLAPFNINVNALCPGLLWTPMWEKIEGMMGGNHEVKGRKKFSEGVENTPLGRAITPEDIGKAAVFLASNTAKNITGQSLNIDGGLHMN